MSDDKWARLREVLPAYDIHDEIGRGAWGVVIEARHRTLERRVAVKQLPFAFSTDEKARSRFRSEARVVASLDHPHIVSIFDFVEQDDMCVFVMEFMPEGSLWDHFSRDPVPGETACAVSFATLSALAHAHQRGVLHRDVKPENVLFNTAGVPKLGDFGIAKQLTGGGTQTATGMILGTPAYMAPEQGTGGEVSPATDVYAVGAMLYELVSGRLPFESTGSPLSQVYQHVHEDPTPIQDIAPDVPDEVSSVIMTALEKEPADRYVGARAFATALDRAATDAFGARWLRSSGVPVLSTEEMLRGRREPSPAEEPADDAGEAPSAEPSQRPSPPRRPTPPPRPGSATPSRPQPPSTTGSGSASTSGARPAATAGPNRTAPATPRPSSAGSARGQARTRRRLLWIGVPVAVLVALAGAAVLLLGGTGTDADTDQPGVTAGESELEVSQAAITRFRDACDTNGIDDALCTCALDTALAELTPEEFLANDRLLQQTGDAITAPVREIFDQCVEETQS